MNVDRLCSDETQGKAMSQELQWESGGFMGLVKRPCLNQGSTLPSWETLNLLLNHPASLSPTTWDKNAFSQDCYCRTEGDGCAGQQPALNKEGWYS